MSPRSRWALSAGLVAASLLGGVASGLGDARVSLEWSARELSDLDRQIALVEDVSSLADLDARSDGAWDRYMTQANDRAVVKGALTRNYGLLGPSVFMKAGEASYALTPGIPVRSCKNAFHVLRESALAARIEAAVVDARGDVPGRWSPITGAERPCLGHEGGALALFRIAPHAGKGRMRTGALSAPEAAGPADAASPEAR